MKFVAVFVLCVVISQCVALPKDIKLKKLLQNIEDEVEELKDFAREMKDDGNRRLGVNKIISIDKKLGSNTDEKTPSPSYKRSIEEINRQNNIFGDIKYADGLGKRNAIDYYRWLPTSETQQLKIPYKIDGSLDSAASAMIEKSINTMNQVLDCHDEAWTPYNPSIHGHYVKFFKERGCWSYVGKVQFDVGFQEISIGKGCEYEDTILHEMMHAMGFHHEQNRPDRDNYIKVHLENVEADAKSQFDKQSGTLTFNTEYDYKSIMHYYAYAFSKNGEPTITSLSEAIQTDEIGKSLELTDLDIEELKKYFNCLASPTTDQPTEGPTALPTDESTDLATDGTDESTDLQTDGTDESTDLQTDGTDESTDLQTDGTDESTDLQTDGTDESTDLQTDGTDESTDLQTDGTDKPTGGKIAECKIDETNLDGTKCNRFKIKGFKPGRKCEDIRKDCKGKENKCFKNSMRKKCRLTCGYCKPQTMGPYMQAIRRGRISTTITNEELSKKFGKYCVENFVQFCVSFTYSLDEHQVDPKSISIKTNVRSVEPFKRKIKPKSAFHNIEVKEDYEAGQWEEGLGTLEVACGKSYRFRLTEQNAEKEKVKYQNMAIFLGPCPR